MPSLGLFSAGSNAQGQLATGTRGDASTFTPCVFSGCAPGTLPTGILSVSQVACGANHTLALVRSTSSSFAEPETETKTETGTAELWGCGDGRKGQLGPCYLADADSDGQSAFHKIDLGLQENASSLAEYAPRLIAAGWETSYVVLSRAGQSDTLLSMGADDFGDLGVDGAKKTGVAARPFQIVELRPLFSQAFGNDPIENSRLGVQCLASGTHHIVVQLELVLFDGSRRQLLAGWGASRHGQLNDFPAKPTLFFSEPRIISDTENALDPVKGIALGNQHTVLLHASGRLSAWGSDRNRQLRDIGTLVADVRQIACTWNGTYVLVHDSNGSRIVATGSQTHGQLGRSDFLDGPCLASVKFPFSPGTRQIVKLACGSEHALCLYTVCDNSEDANSRISRTEVWGWGWNEHGNLGIGSTDDQRLPVRVWPPNGYDAGRACDVWCGNGTSWIIIER